MHLDPNSVFFRDAAIVDIDNNDGQNAPALDAYEFVPPDVLQLDNPEQLESPPVLAEEKKDPAVSLSEMVNFINNWKKTHPPEPVYSEPSGYVHPSHIAIAQQVVSANPLDILARIHSNPSSHQPPPKKEMSWHEAFRLKRLEYVWTNGRVDPPFGPGLVPHDNQQLGLHLQNDGMLHPKHFLSPDPTLPNLSVDEEKPNTPELSFLEDIFTPDESEKDPPLPAAKDKPIVDTAEKADEARKHLPAVREPVAPPSISASQIRPDELENNGPDDPSIHTLDALYPLLNPKSTTRIQNLFNAFCQSILSLLKSGNFRTKLSDHLMSVSNGTWEIPCELIAKTKLFEELNAAFTEGKNTQNNKLYKLTLYHYLRYTLRLSGNLSSLPLGSYDPEFTDVIRKVVGDNLQNPVKTWNQSVNPSQTLVNSLVSLQERAIKWRSNSLKDWIKQDSKILEENQMLGFVLKTRGESVHLIPAFYQFDSNGWIVGLGHDTESKGLAVVKAICHNPMLSRSEETIFIDEKSFEAFYNHLAKVGMHVTIGEVIHKFLIIPENRNRSSLIEKLRDAGVDVNEEVNDEPEVLPQKKDSSKKNASSLDLVRKMVSAERIAGTNNDYLDGLNSEGGRELQKIQRKKMRTITGDIIKDVRTLDCVLAETLKDFDKNPKTNRSINTNLLKTYQIFAVLRMLKLRECGLNGAVLALDTGLGKTTTLAEMCLQLFELASQPILFIATQSTMLQTAESFRNQYAQIQSELLEKNAKATLENIQKSPSSASKDKLVKDASDTLDLIWLFVIREKERVAKLKDKITIGERKLNELKQAKEKGLKKQKLAEKLDRTKIKLAAAEERYKKRYELLKSFESAISNALEKKIIKNANPPQSITEGKGHLSINIYTDIITKNKWTKSKDKLIDIKDKRKILFLATNDLDTNTKSLMSINWSSIIVDEAQEVDNAETKNFKALEGLVINARSQGKPPFVIFSTGTPYENGLLDIFSYLRIINPIESPFDESRKLNGLKEIGAKLGKMLEKATNALLASVKDIDNARKTAHAYKELRELFFWMEGFKAMLAKVSIRQKKTDQAIIEEWDGKIPKVIPVDHKISFVEGRHTGHRNILLEIYNAFKSDSQSNKGKSSGDFFSYCSDMYFAMLHPSLHVSTKKPRDRLTVESVQAEKSAKKIRDQVVEDLKKGDPEFARKWASESAILDNLINNEKFIESLNKGVVFFVNRIAAGNALKYCCEKIFNIPNVDFLHGQTSIPQRYSMVQRFEGPLDGKPRLLILMADTGGSGLDLKKNGIGAYFFFDDFNPARRAQMEARIVRAGSEKKEVEIHRFSTGTQMEQLTRWHCDRKILMGDYTFLPLDEDNSNRDDLFGMLFDAIALSCNHDEYHDAGGKEAFDKLKQKLKTEFLSIDQNFNEELKETNPLNSERLLPKAQSISTAGLSSLSNRKDPVKEVALQKEARRALMEKRVALVAPASNPNSRSGSGNFDPRSLERHVTLRGTGRSDDDTIEPGEIRDLQPKRSIAGGQPASASSSVRHVTFSGLGPDDRLVPAGIKDQPKSANTVSPGDMPSFRKRPLNPSSDDSTAQQEAEKKKKVATDKSTLPPSLPVPSAPKPKDYIPKPPPPIPQSSTTAAFKKPAPLIRAESYKKRELSPPRLSQPTDDSLEALSKKKKTEGPVQPPLVLPTPSVPKPVPTSIQSLQPPNAAALPVKPIKITDLHRIESAKTNVAAMLSHLTHSGLTVEEINNCSLNIVDGETENPISQQYYILPMRWEEEKGQDNFARAIFAGKNLLSFKRDAIKYIVERLKGKEAPLGKTMTSVPLIARVSTTELRNFDAELNKMLFENLQFTTKKFESSHEAILRKLESENFMVMVYEPKKALNLLAGSNIEKQIILLKTASESGKVHYDLLYPVE